MRKLIMILAMMLAYTYVTAQVKTDLARQHLKGRIKSVIESEYAADGKELKKETVSNYNDSGIQVAFKVYSGEHTLMSSSVFRYDSGHIIEEQRLRENGILIVKVTYKYDSKGNRIEESNYDGGGVMFMKAVNKLDMRGNRTVCDSYNEFGGLYHKSNYKLDKNGNDIEEREYDSHHGLQFTTTWHYDDYDAHGNWLKRTAFKNNKVYSVTQRSITLY